MLLVANMMRTVGMRFSVKLGVLVFGAGIVIACDSGKNRGNSGAGVEAKAEHPAPPVKTAGTSGRTRFKPFTPTSVLGTQPEGFGLRVGSSLPIVNAQSIEGKEVSLQSLLGNEHVLLVFYRGAWCPYCNFQVRELQKNAAAFQKLGVKPVLISVDQPGITKQVAKERGISLTLLSDPELEVHRAFRVVNRLDDARIAKLKRGNMDVEAHSGRTHQSVAVPAVFLLSPQGRVEFAHVERDYKSRPSAAQLLKHVGKVIKLERAVRIGTKAPDFELQSSDGNNVRLSDFLGKTVVLEWFNPECPYVKASHNEGSLKGLGEEETKAGNVVWLGINSSANGRQGYGAEATNMGRKLLGVSYPVLLDETGDVGKLFGAETTPHMMVIDPAGKLVYRGAIDNSPDATGDSPQGGKLVNYVHQALKELATSKVVSTPSTEAYGCSVKYARN